MTDTTNNEFIPASGAGMLAPDLAAPLARDLGTVHAAIAKLSDAAGMAFSPDFSPDEADVVGAFAEDALSEDDAREPEPDLRPMVRGAGPAID